MKNLRASQIADYGGIWYPDTKGKTAVERCHELQELQDLRYREIEMAKAGYTLFFTADDDVWSSESSFSSLFEFLGHRPLLGSRIRVEAGSPVSREYIC